MARFFVLLSVTSLARSQVVKPGHDQIKEFHFHIYWLQNNPEQEWQALTLKEKIVDEVHNGNFTVVCDGITNEILPTINEDEVPGFNVQPIGPHSCGSFETWVPRESYAKFLSFILLNRGDLTIFIHPLGNNEIDDHTIHASWLGQSYPLDLSPLSAVGGDDPQYPELGLGYNAM
eukprot:TCALIF_08614-PA protein Name:"Similar to DODA DOPA 4,5-dioxygenase (Amanita muscaria)" AED:0.16 eAED:0.30 QI:0/0/0/0.75/1/1/4/0/174